MTKTKTTLLLATLLLPLAAQADDRKCEHTQPRNLQLDFSGIDIVVFDIGSSDIAVRATAGASGRVEGRACASSAAELQRLTLTQAKSGNKLVVNAERRDRSGIPFGNRYAYMVLAASVPARVTVQLEVGSGDARLDGARAASADVGSGDIAVSHIDGPFTAKIGSGDIDAQDIGSLDILSIGSGDATIRNVRGISKVGSVGSGDLKIKDTKGAVSIGSVGSGDVELDDIGGDVTVGSIGSGDIDVDGVRGGLTVRSVGSGDVDHRSVSGRVDLPKKR